MLFLARFQARAIWIWKGGNCLGTNRFLRQPAVHRLDWGSSWNNRFIGRTMQGKHKMTSKMEIVHCASHLQRMSLFRVLFSFLDDFLGLLLSSARRGFRWEEEPIVIGWRSSEIVHKLRIESISNCHVYRYLTVQWGSEENSFVFTALYDVDSDFRTFRFFLFSVCFFRLDRYLRLRLWRRGGGQPFFPPQVPAMFSSPLVILSSLSAGSFPPPTLRGKRGKIESLSFVWVFLLRRIISIQFSFPLENSLQ